jgi:hypothetical protein
MLPGAPEANILATRSEFLGGRVKCRATQGCTGTLGERNATKSIGVDQEPLPVAYIVRCPRCGRKQTVKIKD